MGRIHDALDKADQEQGKTIRNTGRDKIEVVLGKGSSPLSNRATTSLPDKEIKPLSETVTTTLSETELNSSLDTGTTPSPDSSLTPNLSKGSVSTVNTPISPYSEQETIPVFNRKPSYEYQAIKTKIITRFPDNAIKTIMVTGTSRQCGTSTTAVGFATTLAADCKSRVLLIEANTRLPSFDKFFTVSEGIGLSDLYSENPDEILPLQTQQLRFHPIQTKTFGSLAPRIVENVLRYQRTKELIYFGSKNRQWKIIIR